MGPAHHDVERNACKRHPPTTVCNELDVAERPLEPSAPTLLSHAKHIPEPLRPRRDLGAQLQRMQPVVITRDAHRGNTKLSHQVGDATPLHLRVAFEIPHEKQQIVAPTVEEGDVRFVPKEMHVSDHADRGHLRRVIVHGTKLSRRRTLREQDETTR